MDLTEAEDIKRWQKTLRRGMRSQLGLKKHHYEQS